MFESVTFQKIYKEYLKVQKTSGEAGIEPLNELLMPSASVVQQQQLNKRERDLTTDEKKYLLAAERGDIPTVKYYLDEAPNFEKFNMNAVDPLGRSALYIAIEYENIEMIELLLTYHVDVGEALLHAINEEFVEAVEILLHYQDHGQVNDSGKNEDTTKQINPEQQNDDSLPLANIAAKLLSQQQHLVGDEKDSSNGVKSKWTFLLKALHVLKTNKMTNTNNSANVASKSFTSDITPLILAAHKDNYEIIKILLDRGETIYEPHDVRCSCQECIKARSEDSLRYSKSRINAYKALASPSLISLSSKDPILAAFQLSWELKRLSRIENEFKFEYEKLSQQCQEYASALLNETRTSQELEIILNYDHENPPVLFENEQEKISLNRLKLAIKYKQKKFVAHPHCQQLLVSLWYDGISGYRRRNICVKILVILVITLLFPFLSFIYLFAPHSKICKVLRQPFVKFVCHSGSYVCFLCLLILASLRIKVLTGSDEEDHKEKRGPSPTTVECMIFFYVASFIWSEIKQLYNEGLIEYLHDWWNFLDFITNTLYLTTIVLKFISYVIVQNEMAQGKETYKLNREKWDPWDPTLISEGAFAMANVFSSLKLVSIFTINPYLGPLQISLGRMIFDIMKFACLIVLVVFSFACGLNQLYWYYAQMRDKECQLKEFESIEDKEECILKIKYFSNLFEALQTLFWGTFGYVEKDRLDSLYRKHTFTMFIGLLMFGVYCSIMIIVLINMLIAMMSNSYQSIANQADEEWKFARSKLWISYFEEGGTLPAPFSIIPSPKSIYYMLRWFYRKVFCLKKSLRKKQRWLSIKKVVKKISEREYKYQAVVKELVKRYIMRKQQRDLNAGVTNDDLNEIKQDISAFRFELLEIFKKNQFKVDVKQNPSKRKRGKLNLEKAMAKNIFEEPNVTNNKSLHIFDSFTFDSARTTSKFQIIENEQQSNQQSQHQINLKSSKKSNKSSNSSFKDNCNNNNNNNNNNSYSNKNRKEQRRTSLTKSGDLAQKNESTSKQGNQTPAMLRIANKIKKLTDLKQHIKKENSNSPTSNKKLFSSTELTENNLAYFPDLAAVSTESKTPPTDAYKIEIETTTICIQENQKRLLIDEQQPEAATTAVEFTCDNESFTERITEV